MSFRYYIKSYPQTDFHPVLALILSRSYEQQNSATNLETKKQKNAWFYEWYAKENQVFAIPADKWNETLKTQQISKESIAQRLESELFRIAENSPDLSSSLNWPLAWLGQMACDFQLGSLFEGLLQKHDLWKQLSAPQLVFFRLLFALGETES
jgi:hypothetical protein